MIPSASAAKTSGVSSVSFTSGICFGWCGACCKTNLECKGGNKLWWWELAFSAWFREHFLLDSRFSLHFPKMFKTVYQARGFLGACAAAYLRPHLNIFIRGHYTAYPASVLAPADNCRVYNTMIGCSLLIKISLLHRDLQSSESMAQSDTPFTSMESEVHLQI